MRQVPVALVFSALFAAGQPAEPPKQIRLEGAVQNLSGEALSKATLRLQGTVPQGTTIASYTVTSGDDGKFLFDDVPPGRYFLSAEKNGFVTQRYSSPTNLGGATLTLRAGDTLKDLNFKLTLAAIINGRVLDPDGDPVAKMSINVLGANYVRGRKQLTSAGFALSDDEGRFRIAGLAAGRYYVSVQDPRSQFGPPPGDDQPVRKPGITQILVTSYYPSAVDLKSAQTLNVATGAEIQGLDITMRKEQVYTVRAKAVDQSGAAVPNSSLAIRSKDETVFGSNLGAMVNPPRSPDGNFEFRDLLPGTYILQTAPQSPTFARREITVTNSDVNGITVPLLASVGISGRIRLEDGDAKNAGVTNIGLSEYEIPGYNNRGGRVTADAFQIANVAPAVYCVSASPMAEGLYVKSVRFGDTDITRKPLDLTKGGGGTIDILLSPHAADVTGTMRNAGGVPMQGIRVSLWPRDGAGWDAVGGVKSGTTDQKGTVLIGNLPPGDYYLAAWEDASDGLVEYSEFRRRFEREAARIHLDENSHLAADLKLISRERIAAELAKLP